MKFMPSMILSLSCLLVGCGGGSSSIEEPTQVIPPAPNNPAQGTILDESCNGTTLVKSVANGNGGSTQQETPNSEQCGYEPLPEFGTPVGESYCGSSTPTDRFAELLNIINRVRRDDRLQDYADGEGGTYTERVARLDETCFEQMEAPPDCPTTATATGDARYDYMTCDGIKQKTNTDFPYSDGHPGTAIIDMLIVWDTNITEQQLDSMTVEEFISRQFKQANLMFDETGTDIRLRLAGVKEVDVARGDLYRQYAAFFNGRYEFKGLDDWQRDAEADLAFLFKFRDSDAIACGVASLDATRGLTKTRGITQCFHNSVFQENEATRYYERAQETFAHEVGHLLGLSHAWDDAGGTPALFEYSYGYNLPGYQPKKGDPDYQGAYSGYGTIMSYADLATGRFSDRDFYATIPETGNSVAHGTDGGGFYISDEKPPPTDAVDHLRRVRYLMSQLHEHDHGVQFSSPVGPIDTDDDPVWLMWTNLPRDVCLF